MASASRPARPPAPASPARGSAFSTTASRSRDPIRRRGSLNPPRTAEAEKLSVNEDGSRGGDGAAGTLISHTHPHAHPIARGLRTDGEAAAAAEPRHERDAEHPLYQQAFSEAAPARVRSMAMAPARPEPAGDPGVHRRERAWRRRCSRALARSFTAWGRPRPRRTAWRSSGCTSTKSGRSTRSSIWSARRRRSSGWRRGGSLAVR